MITAIEVPFCRSNALLCQRIHAYTRSMDFEWDEQKCIGNLAKHGLDFARAILIWRGNCIASASTREVDGETRHLALGEITAPDPYGKFVIAVVCTVRNDRYRIISARRASDKERDLHRATFG